MKLNYECVRAVLLSIEKLHRIVENEEGGLELAWLSIDAVIDDLPKFDAKDVLYTVLILDQADYIDAELDWQGNAIAYCYVTQLNYAGHELLEKIRDGARWGAVKKALSSIRDYSLDAIRATAEGVTGAAIARYFSSSPPD